MKFSQDENIAYLQRKIPLVIVGIISFILIVIGRLYYLQVIQGETYSKMATEVFVREEEVVARRGLITDRYGKVLADTRIYYEITLTPQYIGDKNKVIEALTTILPLKKEDILNTLHEARFEPKFHPVAIAEDVSYDWIAKLSEYLSPVYDENSPYDLSGVDVQEIPIRQYLYPQEFAHALGYLRVVDKKGLEREKNEHPGVYSMGDLSGAVGLEHTYDIELKGVDGVLGRVVDARGREVTNNEDLLVLKQQATFAAEPGKTLRTALDFDAQTIAEKAFAGRKGSLIALDPNTGEVIVFYSSPGYDANRITKKVDKDYWRMLNDPNDENKYLFNRGIQAMYPPASTYKVVNLTGAIDSKVIDPEKTTVTCGGGMQFGNRFFRCWKAGGHGRLASVIGLAQSCDTFFYKMGLLQGVDGLAKYAHIFGLGSKTGVDLPGEKPGLVPTSEWKKKYLHQPWQESETLSIAIGQGYDLVTPMQNAVVVAMIANGGYKVTPHLGLELLDSHNKVVRKIEYPLQKTEVTGAVALEWVKKGMIEVIHGFGTAKALRGSPYKIAGKTGTAQVIGHESKAKRGKHNANHALFIAFAPYDNPKIVVSVMVEHGLGGSVAAAPIARQVIDAYLSKVLGPVVPDEQEGKKKL